MTCTYCQPLSDNQRIAYPAALFGAAFPFDVEPTIFTFAQELSVDYTGGYWVSVRRTRLAFSVAVYASPTG